MGSSMDILPLLKSPWEIPLSPSILASIYTLFVKLNPPVIQSIISSPIVFHVILSLK